MLRARKRLCGKYRMPTITPTLFLTQTTSQASILNSMKIRSFGENMAMTSYTSTKPNRESNLPTNNQNIIDMKILRDNDYNKRPIKKMTISRLKNRANKEYVLYFRCKELGTSYTIGINAELLVWAYQYRNGVLIRSFKEENIPTFEEAYQFFVNNCNHCLLEQKLAKMAKNF